MLRPALVLLSILFAAPVLVQSVQAQSISDKTLSSLLEAGEWNPKADENLRLRERLPLETIRQLIRSYPQNKREIGLLTLTTSAGKWGAEIGEAIPTSSDPARDQWQGPNPPTGKHLMSYRTGGVGLPHLDVSGLSKFIDYTIQHHSTIGQISEIRHLQSLSRRLGAKKNKITFEQIRRDKIFLKWMKISLRTREAQKWILEYWLDSYWEPALAASNGDIRLALVLARVWNTSSSLGRCVARNALHAPDRITSALNAYISCPGGQSRYKTDRFGWMLRPVVLYDKFRSD